MKTTFSDYLMAGTGLTCAVMGLAVALGIIGAWWLACAIGIGSIGVATGLKTANDAPFDSGDSPEV